MNLKQQSSFNAAKQAGAAYDYASQKGGPAVSERSNAKYKRRKKIKGKAAPVVTADSRVKKEPYKPGEIGLSQVSAAIKEEYGEVISRRERRQSATGSEPFKPFYNGSERG